MTECNALKTRRDLKRWFRAPMEGKKQTKLGRRLLLFPPPFQGHVTPMLHLATLLHSKGFSITMIHTCYKSPDPTKFPNLTFHWIDDGLSDEAAPAPYSFALMSTLNANCLKPFKDCLSRILGDNNEPAVVCLIVDPMWQFTTAVADSFNLPSIAFITASMSAFLVYVSFPILRQKGYFSLEETKSDELLLELPVPLKVKDLPTESLHSSLEAMVKETKNSLGIICNTLEELETSVLHRVKNALPIPLFSIGPLHSHSPTCASNMWIPDQTSISWLNTQAPKSVLYVSFGSIAEVSEAEFQEIAWGLANSMQPFLWVVRPGLTQGSEVDDLLPERYIGMVGSRGHIVKWAPQLEVLAHLAVGGFWTHCGWNSIVESICEGVPMICQPFVGDQAINARNVSDNWRVGLQLEEGMTREEIEKVIKRLMVEEEGEELRNRATSYKHKTTLCLKEGGSSYHSLEKLTSYLLSI